MLLLPFAGTRVGMRRRRLMMGEVASVAGQRGRLDVVAADRAAGGLELSLVADRPVERELVVELAGICIDSADL